MPIAFEYTSLDNLAIDVSIRFSADFKANIAKKTIFFFQILDNIWNTFGYLWFKIYVQN